jgi:hypothetical protein
MRAYCLIVLIPLIATGCSSSYDVSDYAQINEKALDQSVTVAASEWGKIRGTDLFVRADSTTFLESATEKRIVIATSSVKSVAINSTREGAVDGLIAGAIIGAPLGALFSAYATGMGGGGFDVGALVGPIVGAAALGAGIGALIGHTDRYNFGLPVLGADSLNLSPDDTLIVRVDEILDEKAASFIGRIGDHEYRFDKAEATYSWKRTADGVAITVKGTRGMFRRVGVLSAR